MTVQRFRTIEEMNRAAVCGPSGSGFERFVRHCARFWAIAPRSYPRGAFKFRSLAEAQAARERVSAESLARTPQPRSTEHKAPPACRVRQLPARRNGPAGSQPSLSNTAFSRSRDQSTSSGLMHRGGAIRMVCLWVSLQSMPSCWSASQ